MAESLYETLGVAKTASAEDIRKAYRKLARKHHPDLNPGDASAEAAFKKVAAAHDILSDEAKRKAYDEFGDASLQSGFDPDKAREYARWQESRERRTSGFGGSEGPIDFDLGEFFQRQTPGGPVRGRDLYASIDIDLRQAIEGTEMTADLPNHGTVHVRIPRGADSGDLLRVRGKGSPGRNGGPPGDLVIETVVRPHPLVRRQGLDLHLTLPITLNEAYNGASINLPLFEGSVVLKVPSRVKQRATLRLRGKGVERKDQRGDMLVEVDVQMPDIADAALSEALRASDNLYTTPIREGLAL
jgi:molecular chaperone DnaJ/curved DNA-binding protein